MCLRSKEIKIKKTNMIKCAEIKEIIANNIEGKDAFPKYVQDHINECKSCKMLLNEADQILNMSFSVKPVKSNEEFLAHLNYKINKEEKSNSKIWLKLVASIIIGIGLGIGVGNSLSNYLDNRATNKSIVEYFHVDDHVFNTDLHSL